MGVANTITSACCIFSVMATASSSITHRPSVWQARQPRQNAMFLPRSEMTSTECPAARAPSAKAFASASELLLARRLALRIRMFLAISVFSFLSGLTLPL